MTIAPERARWPVPRSTGEDLPRADGAPASTVWLRRLAQRLFLVDAVVVALALAAALIVRFGPEGADTPVRARDETTVIHGTSYAVLAVVLLVGWLALLYAARTYDGRVIGVGADEYKRVVRASLWLWGAVAIVCYVAGVELARIFFALAFPIGTVLLVLARWGARKLLHRARRHTDRWSHRVLVVGGPGEVDDLAETLGREPYAGLAVVGACVAGRSDGAGPRRVRRVGDLSNVVPAVARTGADTVAVTASSGVTSGVLKRLGWELEGLGVDLVVAPALTDVAGPRIHVRPVSGLSLLYVEQPEFAGPSRVIKEAFDRLAALVCLAVLSPLLVVVSVLIKATSPGPVIFRQTRVGRSGEVFVLYKFRTMVVDAENRLAGLLPSNDCDGTLFKLREDPRVTRVGRLLRRFSLDELPQLVNVLRGQMSLVGPRPALPSETETYGSHVARRLLVKPGITGLWQVSGRSDLSWEDSVRLDLYYVENWSFTADIQILWKTLWAVAKGHGAY